MTSSDRCFTYPFVFLSISFFLIGKLINPNAPVVDERNYERVCLYLLRSADFVTDPDDLVNLLTTAYTIYKDQKKYTDSLRVALKMDDLH